MGNKIRFSHIKIPIYKYFLLKIELELFIYLFERIFYYDHFKYFGLQNV